MADRTGPPDDEARRAEAQRILDRVAAEGESIGTSALARAARHFGGADAPENDRLEVWGRRIARVLAAVFALYLIKTLVDQFGVTPP